MQKVEGSNPFSRFEKPRKCGVSLDRDQPNYPKTGWSCRWGCEHPFRSGTVLMDRRVLLVGGVAEDGHNLLGYADVKPSTTRALLGLAIDLAD
jgi:hypothetical protein